MVFFRMLHSDFSRMIKSWKFYLAIAFIAVLTFLSIYPEAAGSGGNCSVYYLVNARGGVSAFLVTNTILVVLPFALSYWEDVQKNYINCILPRVHSSIYSFSHVVITALGGFLAVFLGYSLCFGLMALRLPSVTADELETLAGLTTLTGYESLLLHAPIFYFIAVFATEAFGYAFLAVCALTASARVTNVFVVLSIPILVYYGSTLLCNAWNLPGIFYWYYIMASGGVLRAIQNPARLLFCIFCYFNGLILVLALVFQQELEKKKKHG